MPNIWTHIIFGQEALRAVGRTEWLDREAEGKLFSWGNQGPDPLFYYRFLPWSKDKRMNRLGNLIHEEQCGPFLAQLLRKAGMPEGECLRPYAAGFLLHHILDRNAHPYIFAKSGFKKWNHQRFEIILDTIVAEKLRGIDTWKTPVWQELALGKGSVLFHDVPALLSELTVQLYPEATELVGVRQWQESFRDMLLALKLFHDPTGVKRVFTAGQITPFVYKRDNLPLDYCNEEKKPWRDPVEEEIIHHTGFWEHWEAAMEEAGKLLPLALDFMESGAANSRAAAAEAELLRLLGNISYSTGRACGEWAIRYEDPLSF
ncbi:MAG: hypothetical protein K0Q90_544 [Paenibacillaceae bacterium]|jgi:hypothetical protein|nr:hypothetical protein [Paenibacillaceae bacterium]